MLRQLILAFLIGGGSLFGIFEANAAEKEYESVREYCEDNHPSALQNCNIKVDKHRDQFPVPNAPNPDSQGKPESSEGAGTVTAPQQYSNKEEGSNPASDVEPSQTSSSKDGDSDVSSRTQKETVRPEKENTSQSFHTTSKNSTPQSNTKVDGGSENQTSPAPGTESESKSKPSSSQETTASSSLPQQQPEGPNGTEAPIASNDEFGALSGTQSAGDPLKNEVSAEQNQSENPTPETEKPEPAETQPEKKQKGVETEEASSDDNTSADENSVPQKSPEETQPEKPETQDTKEKRSSASEDTQSESEKQEQKDREEEREQENKESRKAQEEQSAETQDTQGEEKPTSESEKQENSEKKEQEAKHKNVSNTPQLSEQKVNRFCGKQNAMAGTGSEEVYQRCVTQVNEHPNEFPQLQSEKPETQDTKEKPSLANGDTQNESEQQEQQDREEEREQENSEEKGKAQTETSADQPTPNEGENSEVGNNDPTPTQKKLRNMSHAELYDRFCDVKEISGDAPRNKMVQKVVNKHVQCHRRMIRAMQQEKYAQMRTMIQQQRKKMREERPTLRINAAAQFSGNGDLQTRVGVQDQRFKAEAVYRPNSERSLDMSATHQITDKEDDFPLNVLTPVRLGAGLKNQNEETSIGPRIEAGILDLQVDIVNGNGVSAGVNLFNF